MGEIITGKTIKSPLWVCQIVTEGGMIRCTDNSRLWMVFLESDGLTIEKPSDRFEFKLTKDKYAELME